MSSEFGEKSFLNPTRNMVDEAHRAAQETELIGIRILDDLQQQRETLNRARGTLNDTNDNVSRSNQILRSMIRRAQANRAVTTAIIISLTALIFLALYNKIFC